MDQKYFNQLAREALAANDGFVQGQDFVLMSTDLYLSELGNLSERQMKDSLAKIDLATEDVKNGRTRPLNEAVGELGKDVQG